MQLCYCGPKKTQIPWEPLANHSLGCVAWDWALAARKITLAERTAQLDQYRKNIGDNDAVPPEANP